MVSEWQAVEGATTQMQVAEGRRIMGALNAGEIQPYNSQGFRDIASGRSDHEQGGRVTPDRPNVIQLNRNNQFGSVFARDPRALAKLLMHEDHHRDQLKPYSTTEARARYINDHRQMLDKAADNWAEAHLTP